MRRMRRFLEKYLPWNRVQLLFHGGLSRGGQQQSRIAERDAFSQASAFSLFSRIGVIGARFFFPFFFFFVARHDLAMIYKKASVWIGNDGVAENFSYGRLSIVARGRLSSSHGKNGSNRALRRMGNEGVGGPPRGGKSRIGRRIGGLVKFIRNGFRFEWNDSLASRLFYWSKKKKKKKKRSSSENRLRNNRREA